MLDAIEVSLYNTFGNDVFSIRFDFLKVVTGFNGLKSFTIGLRLLRINSFVVSGVDEIHSFVCLQMQS